MHYTVEPWESHFLGPHNRAGQPSCLWFQGPGSQGSRVGWNMFFAQINCERKQDLNLFFSLLLYKVLCDVTFKIVFSQIPFQLFFFLRTSQIITLKEICRWLEKYKTDNCCCHFFLNPKMYFVENKIWKGHTPLSFQKNIKESIFCMTQWVGTNPRRNFWTVERDLISLRSDLSL